MQKRDYDERKRQLLRDLTSRSSELRKKFSLVLCHYYPVSSSFDVSLLVKKYPWSKKGSLKYSNAIVEDSLTEHCYTCDILHTSKNERTGIRMFTDVRSRLFMLGQIGSLPNSRSMYEN